MSDEIDREMIDNLGDEVSRLEAEVKRLRGALDAIAKGSWGTLLDQRYPGTEARTTTVPEDATIRVLARLVVGASDPAAREDRP